MNKIIWVALQYSPLSILGVFDLEEDAVSACTSKNHVVGPVEVNIVLPDGLWTDAYYPKSGERNA